MTAESTAALEARVAALEREVAGMIPPLNSITTGMAAIERAYRQVERAIAEAAPKLGIAIENVGLRVIALQGLFEDKALVTEAEVAAAMRTARDAVAGLLEGDSPTAERFRELRALIRHHMPPPPDPPAEGTGG